MFTQPVSSPPPVGPASTTTNNPASPTSRTSRLRGLSYLRTYTQNHILSREHGSNAQTSPASASATSTPSHPRSPTRPTALLRSASYSPSSTSVARSTAEADDAGTQPLSLVASLQELTIGQNPTTGQELPKAPAAVSAPNQTGDSTVEEAVNENPAVATGTPDETTDSEPAMTRPRASTATDAVPTSSDSLPSIRFSAYYDPRATRPSLTFPPVSRTLPSGGEIIRVGRYSERDSHPNVPANMPSAAPVGFKSKVVSRRHCEFWYDQGKWYIKDVKSSSGTFLNHIRLSPPGTESKPFPVNDGDIVQLGIDFKGGEEMIFRCVKMRLELNRGWQNKLNTFNMTTHKRLRTLASANSSSSTSQDCSICLNSIAPCQCLFVAPCSHTWHFKCIRSLLSSPQYPIFICPNCRAAADLEADIEDPEEDWEQVESDGQENADASAKSQANGVTPAIPLPDSAQNASSNGEGDPMDVTVALDQAVQTAVAIRPSAHSTTEPVPIPTATVMAQTNSARDARTPSPVSNPQLLASNEGPITPRNDAGPWVFDGSAGQRAAAATASMGGMRSLDAATEMGVDSRG